MVQIQPLAAGTVSYSDLQQLFPSVDPAGQRHCRASGTILKWGKIIFSHCCLHVRDAKSILIMIQQGHPHYSDSEEQASTFAQNHFCAHRDVSKAEALFVG